MAAIRLRHRDRLERRGHGPEARRARQNQRQHDGAVAGDLLLAGLVAAGLGGENRDLEQQEIEGGAERAEDPPADIGREREVAGLGKARRGGHRRAVGEGHQLVDDVGGDHRQAVGHEQAKGFAAAGGLVRGRRVAERPVDGEGGEELAQAPGEHHRGGVPRRPGGTDHHHEGEAVLDQDETQVEAADEAGAGQRRLVVEQPDADRGPGRGRRQQGGLAEGRPAGQRQERRAREPDRGGRVGPVEHGADPRLGRPHPLRVESGGREAQPLEQQDVEHHRARRAEGEAAEIRRPQDLRDEQAEGEVQDRVDHEGRDDRHCSECSFERSDCGVDPLNSTRKRSQCGARVSSSPRGRGEGRVTVQVTRRARRARVRGCFRTGLTRRNPLTLAPAFAFACRAS